MLFVYNVSLVILCALICVFVNGNFGCLARAWFASVTCSPRVKAEGRNERCV